MLSRERIGDNIANELLTAYLAKRNSALGPGATWTAEDSENYDKIKSIGHALAQRGTENGHLVASDHPVGGSGVSRTAEAPAAGADGRSGRRVPREEPTSDGEGGSELYRPEEEA